ncbi:hypothetical protein QF037_000245 [Streptomyces canus]|nr:hypothetical protein [Streptomyces canus]
MGRAVMGGRLDLVVESLVSTFSTAADSAWIGMRQVFGGMTTNSPVRQRRRAPVEEW